MGGLIPSLLYCVFRCYLSNLMTFRISCRSLCKLMVDLLNKFKGSKVDLLNKY